MPSPRENRDQLNAQNALAYDRVDDQQDQDVDAEVDRAPATVRGDSGALKVKDAAADHHEKVRLFLMRALADFTLASEADAANREEMLEDQRFRNSEMWPDEILQARKAAAKPCLTIDQISGPIKQITGEERQAKPAIHISANGNGADRDSAEAREGLARAVQADSAAEVAYDWAFEGAATIGLGWFMFDTEYEDENSFDQVLKIVWIENPFCVYGDPTYTAPDRRDAHFYHVKSWVKADVFEKKYGREKMASLEEYGSTGDHDPEWFSTEEGCAVSKYWYCDYEDHTLAQLKNGDVVDITGYDAERKAALQPLIQDTRISQHRIVKCAVISATHILEGNEDLTAGRVWPSKYMPLVAVEGERLNVDGKRIFRGIIRTARDPQRMYNVLVSTGMEVLALTPKAAYVAAAGQVSAYAQMWREANTESNSVLVYDPVELNGHLAPPPQRQIVEPPIQAIFASIRQAATDLRTVTGFYDATDPSRANTEQSGKAIDARQHQGSVAHINLIDNLERALTYAGEIMIDMLPRVFDRPGRVVRLLGMDDAATQVRIGPYQEEKPVAPATGIMGRMAGAVRNFVGGTGGTPPADPQGVPTPPPLKVINLRPESRYSVRATVGAAFSTKRQETVSQLTELFKVYPPLAQAGMDILLSNMDGPGMKVLAERIKRTLPEELRDENEDAQYPIPPHAKAKLAKQEQAIQHMTVQLQQAAELIRTKQLELNSAERRTMMTTHAQIAVAIAKLGSTTESQALQNEFLRFTAQVERFHALELQQAEQEHQRGIGAAGAADATASQAQGEAAGLKAQAQGEAAGLASQTQAEGAAATAAATPPPAAAA